MTTEGYLVHKGYRANLEKGTWVWTRMLPRKLVGKHAITGKPIKLPLSGTNSVDKQRVVTNTDNYDEAVKMLDRFLTKPPKEPKFRKDPSQVSLLDVIKEEAK